jgi:hypothetical protein
MSHTITYFFNYPKPLAELAQDINEWLGCSLAPIEEDEGFWTGLLLSMEFDLITADGFDNDRDLDFENFVYYIRFKTWASTESAKLIQVPTMLTVIYALHRRLGITGMLVWEMQTLLARYEEREASYYGKRLYDLVSDAPFTSFPAHLQAVMALLPEDWNNRYMRMP